MPDSDGLKIIQILIEQYDLEPEKLPIILLHSLTNDVELLKRSGEMGVKFHLTKPVKPFNMVTSLFNIANPELTETAKTEIGHSDYITNRVLNVNAKILIADDVKINMMLIKAILTQLLPNGKLIEAGSGLEAIKKFQEEKPDLIIMDVEMPELDGIEAIKEIRKLELTTGKHTPVIALTAGALKEEQEKCMAAGMDDFLTKPVDIYKVSMTVKKYLTQNNKI